VVSDNDGNMILTEGPVLQNERIWRRFSGRDISPENNSCELYFKERDMKVLSGGWNSYILAADM